MLAFLCSTIWYQALVKMLFINPRTDFAFNLIFGSEADTAMAISLLNAMLPNLSASASFSPSVRN